MNHTTRSTRLATYSALAGSVIPAAAASAAFVGQSGLNLTLDANTSVGLDFGPGFGEVFLLSVRFVSSGSPGPTSSFFTFSSINVRFNPENTGGWTDASVVRYSQFSNWPRRLATGDWIDSSEDWRQMNRLGFFEHRLAVRQRMGYSTPNGPGSIISTTLGDFVNDRGFLGLRFFASAGEAEIFAWIDVEATLDVGPARISPSLTIHGFGFDDAGDGVPIQAGLPAPGPGALATLALGAAGIRRSRRPA